ncbi:PAS domain S-box protein [bacterium]|nr:PAS domain S-box protein [bacterium]MBU1427605.1 PAS domain S-box protein [bacterium]
MKDENKTKDQLIKELARIQEKNADLEEIIIEEKRTKKELKESEKKYKDLVEETPIGIANIGVTGKITYINKRLEKISGYSREEVVGKNVFKLGVFPDEMLKILRERLKARLREGSVRRRREINFRCKNGKWIWIEITAKLIKKWGIPSNFRITVQDITERKKAEEELRDSEERLKILFDYAPDAYYTSDIKGKFIDGNKAAERLIGYKREELIGKSFLKLKLLSLADIPKAAKLLVKSLRGQPTGSDEFVLNRKDNSKVTVEISTYPVKIKGRTLALGIVRDITERKKAEEALRKSQQEFASIFHNNPEALVYLDDKDTVLKINSRFSELFGYKLKEIKGKDINSGIIHPPDKIEEAKRLTKKAIKGYINYDTIRKKKDGTLFPASVSGSSVLIDGKTKGRIILYQDITLRKQAEQKIKQGYEKLQRTMEATIYTISKIIETRDPYTAGHQNTVSQLAVAIAQEMKLSEDEIEGIRIAALVHDIGKINIPAEILSKPSKLNEMEFSLIRNHPKIGYDILRKIDFSWPVAQIVLQHHERLDGSGYPNKLKGDEIILEAKIIGVADVIEAMSSHRPYRPALGIDKALKEISQNRGILYDPMVVDVCLKLFKEKDFKFES